MTRLESMSDLIYVKDDVMDKDFCSHLITKFDGDINWQYEGITGSGFNKEIKDTTDLKLSGLKHWDDEDQKISKIVEDQSVDNSQCVQSAQVRGHIRLRKEK